MAKRVIERQIKMEKSVKIILAILAVGIVANVFAPVVRIGGASAQVECATSYDVQRYSNRVISAVDNAQDNIELSIRAAQSSIESTIMLWAD